MRQITKTRKKDIATNENIILKNELKFKTLASTFFVK